MAQDKKSVLLYCDIIHTVSKLSNEDAGILFKHYLEYINDLNPEPKSSLIDIVFEPIKQNLKRDLKKWEAKSLKQREIANMRWHPNASERIGSHKKDANNADKVIVKVKDKDISIRKLSFSETIKPFVETYGKEMCNKFFAYWTEPNRANTKMKFEMQKTWEISRRLKTWSDNNFEQKKPNNNQIPNCLV